MVRVIDLTGQKFGRWTVVGRAENTRQGQAQWLCRCECGGEGAVVGTVLRDGRSRSCGCLQSDLTTQRSTRHGHGGSGRVTPTYHTWTGMHARCGNPKNIRYEYYGAAGITVCERWKKFENFLADMGEKPKGKTLDRKKLDLGYSLDNCRWATHQEQARNRSNNKLLTIREETLCLSEWSERFGVKASVISERLIAGWDPEKAVTLQAGNPINNIRSRMLTHNGITLPVSEWARRLGINSQVLYQRLHRGWPVEKVLRPPSTT